MKKGYKICPYCGNEIREGAIKCQFCKEFLEADKKILKDKAISYKQKFNDSRKIITNYTSKNNIHINIKSIFIAVYNFCFVLIKKIFEVLCIIFSIKDRRISLGKGFFLYILGMILAFLISFCIASCLGVEDSFLKSENHEYQRYEHLTGILFILFLWGYILPKRAHDHGRPWFMGIIPVINIYYMRVPGDKGKNKYGEEPSMIDDLIECFSHK